MEIFTWLRGCLYIFRLAAITLSASVDAIATEVPVKKMTIRRRSTLRLLSGARRLWIEWCW
ncbi:hypothetical protein [Micromonospora viridifaciens]|uniref:hypothetical protein n=1 Tax=Micromonospora viridifaciens TaxID=1881 RepID=UPI0012FDE03E|nr:hypothetical protein [Micromonospora viridifaciens]